MLRKDYVIKLSRESEFIDILILVKQEIYDEQKKNGVI